MSIRLCTKLRCLEERGDWLYCDKHRKAAIKKGMLTVPLENRPREWSSPLERFLPAEPLLSLIAQKARLYDADSDHACTANHIANALLRMSGERFAWLLSQKTVRWDVADRIATRLGTPPAQLYGPLWTALEAS